MQRQQKAVTQSNDTWFICLDAKCFLLVQSAAVIQSSDAWLSWDQAEPLNSDIDSIFAMVTMVANHGGMGQTDLSHS